LIFSPLPRRRHAAMRLMPRSAADDFRRHSAMLTLLARRCRRAAIASHMMLTPLSRDRERRGGRRLRHAAAMIFNIAMSRQGRRVLYATCAALRQRYALACRQPRHAACCCAIRDARHVCCYAPLRLLTARALFTLLCWLRYVTIRRCYDAAVVVTRYARRMPAALPRRGYC